MLLLLISQKVYAQDDSEDVRHDLDRLRISLGGMRTEDELSREQNNDAWFMLSLSYDLQPYKPSRFLNFAVYAEGAGGKTSIHTDVLTHRDFSNIFYGVGISTTVRLTSPSRHFGLYGLAGAGVYNLNQKVTDVYQYVYSDPYYGDIQSSISDTLSNRNHFSLGYKFGGGIQLGNIFYIEASYFNIGHLEDTKYSGFGILLGVRLLNARL